MPVAPDLDPVMVSSLLLLMLSVGTAILAAWAWVLVTIALGNPLIPHAPRRIVPWGPFSVLAVLVLFLGVQFVAVNGYAIAKWFSAGMPAKWKPDIPLRDTLLLVSVSNVVMVILAPLLLRLTSGARLADLGLIKRDFALNLARGAGTCFLLLPIVYALMLVAVHYWPAQKHPIEIAIRSDRSLATVILTGFAAVIAAPLAEEMLFRGILLGWLWKLGLKRRDPVDVAFLDVEPDVDPFASAIVANPEAPVVEYLGNPFADNWQMDWLANVTASLIFAGLHYGQWPAPVPLFILSLGLGELYRRTGSLVAPIAMHATFNGLSTVVMILAARAGLPR